MSACLSALAEVSVVDRQQSDPVRYWTVVGVVSAVAALCEIAFVSWDSLRAVHAMSVAAGVLVDDRIPRDQVLAGLARAALEVPNPRDNDLGIDPYRETPRAALAAAALAYKVKVSFTNIILKLVVRRALGRAAIRAYLVPFVAIPGTALWNALVCRVVLREARIRVFGPSLAHHIVDTLLPQAQPLSLSLADAAVRAVASCIVRSADLHPNLEHLLAAVVARTGTPFPLGADDSRGFITLLPRLPPHEAAVIRRLLRAAVVVDGKFARRERVLLAEAASALGDVEDFAAVEAECQRMVAGEPLLLR